jgi:hypothetical protein
MSNRSRCASAVVRRRIRIVTGAVALVLAACTPRTTHGRDTTARAIVVRDPPPPVRFESRPDPPTPDAQWASGHWELVDGHYVWVEGRYVTAPPGYVFVDGHWEARNGGYVFVEPSLRPIHPSGEAEASAKSRAAPAGGR